MLKGIRQRGRNGHDLMILILHWLGITHTHARIFILRSFVSLAALRETKIQMLCAERCGIFITATN